MSQEYNIGSLTKKKKKIRHNCGNCGHGWDKDKQEAFCPNCNKGDKVSFLTVFEKD